MELRFWLIGMYDELRWPAVGEKKRDEGSAVGCVLLRFSFLRPAEDRGLPAEVRASRDREEP